LSGAAVRSAKQLSFPSISSAQGRAIGWLDGLSIPATSTRKEAALKIHQLHDRSRLYFTWATQAGAPASPTRRHGQAARR